MRHAGSLIIARSVPAGDLMAEVLPWLLLLLGVVIAGAILVHILRPSSKADAGGSGSAAGFSLQDLRNLHAAGELSDEEFDRARRAMLERTAAATSENSKTATNARNDTGNE